MGDPQPPPEEGRSETIGCEVSSFFPDWLRAAGGSIALTTYQAGKVGMIGWDGRQVTLLFRDFPKPMGLDVDGPRLLLATRHHLIELGNDPLLAQEFLEGQPGRYDALYLPRTLHATGGLDVHDVAHGVDGPWMVNTRFSCLAGTSRDHSFVPRWRPPFISDVVPENRCHLNGLAMQGGIPRFVTALGETDAVGGWRAGKDGGGVVIDVQANRVVLRGLSMPHSPRLHGEALYVLNSGAGELWRVDVNSFHHEVVCRLPGYLRGLGFAGPFALIGLSKIREKHIFGGLPVQKRYPALLCGIAVVDVRTGREAGTFEFTGGCTEIFDVRFLPGVLRPMILNGDKDATGQAVTAPGFSYWLRPSAVVSGE
ncbi:MAG: TIGR03032 family protein [Isosphaeraceae bacterium]